MEPQNLAGPQCEAAQPHRRTGLPFQAKTTTAPAEGVQGSIMARQLKGVEASRVVKGGRLSWRLRPTATASTVMDTHGDERGDRGGSPQPHWCCRLVLLCELPMTGRTVGWTGLDWTGWEQAAGSSSSSNTQQHAASRH